jgi:hypothetical protein
LVRGKGLLLSPLGRGRAGEGVKGLRELSFEYLTTHIWLYQGVWYNEFVSFQSTRNAIARLTKYTIR